MAVRSMRALGVGAFGRTPGVGELRRMFWCEAIVNAYQSRSRSENWAEWASKNREANAVLSHAIRVTHGD